ncbi:hypothetical protein Hanom_Chr12g01164731 [Helianthus anomalus]
MGPDCFENACKSKKAKQHNFVGRIPLEKHGRFSPVVPVVPALQPLNATMAENHDVQRTTASEAEVETEIIDSDLDEEESSDNSDVEVITSKEAEETIRQPNLMTAKNLQTLLESLQDSVGNPPSVPTSETQIQVEDATYVLEPIGLYIEDYKG